MHPLKPVEHSMFALRSAALTVGLLAVSGLAVADVPDPNLGPATPVAGIQLAIANGTCLAYATHKNCVAYTQCPYEIPQPNGSGRLAFKNCIPLVCTQYVTSTICTKSGPARPAY
jgi:hypothetical protein